MVQQTLPPEILDDRKCVENFFFIPSKQGGLTVPMKAKPAQLRIQEALDKYLQIMVLKSSQVGSTSWVTAVYSKRTMFTKNTTSVIMAHRGDLSEHLFMRTGFFYDHLPKGLQVPMGGDSRTEKSFPAINSKMYIGTIGSKNFGRGEPIHNLLCSEFPFYTEEQYKTIVIPALNRVPEYGTVVLEGTPNGENYAADMVMNVYNGQDRSWHLIVFYCYEEPDNRLKTTSPLLINFSELQEQEFDLYPEEQEVIALAMEERGVDLSKDFDFFRWRRYRLHKDGDMYYQEQVESLNTCFLKKELQYYDKELCDLIRSQVCPAPYEVEGAMAWETPIEGVQYFIGGDPGQARRTNSTASVIRIQDGKPVLVAKLTGKYGPKDFGRRTAKLGYAYNTALICPENNGHGIAYIDSLCDLDDGSRYPQLYMWTDIISGVPTQVIGWNTNGSTKMFMMEEINRQLGFSQIPDKVTQQQIRAFGTDERGRLVTTLLDDDHDAWGLALMAARVFLKAGKGKAKGSSGYTSWDK